MRRAGASIRNRLDVRTKLLVMLAVLSLPLLIISLLQLHSYNKSLNEQAAAIARIEASAAAGALESWVEAHPAQTSSSDPLPPDLAAELYARLKRRTTPGEQKALVVFD